MADWQDQAKALLIEGVGVEDIAIQLGVTAHSVREWVGGLRASGDLSTVMQAREARFHQDWGGHHAANDTAT